MILGKIFFFFGENFAKLNLLAKIKKNDILKIKFLKMFFKKFFKIFNIKHLKYLNNFMLIKYKFLNISFIHNKLFY